MPQPFRLSRSKKPAYRNRPEATRGRGQAQEQAQEQEDGDEEWTFRPQTNARQDMSLLRRVMETSASSLS